MVIVVAVLVVVELEVVYAIVVIEFEVVAAVIFIVFFVVVEIEAVNAIVVVDFEVIINVVVAVDVEASPFAMSRLIRLIPAPFLAPIGRKKIIYCIFLFSLLIYMYYPQPELLLQPKVNVPNSLIV